MSKQSSVQDWPVVTTNDEPHRLWVVGGIAYIPHEETRVLYGKNKEILDSITLVNDHGTILNYRDLPVELHEAYFRAANALEAVQATIRGIFAAGQQWGKERSDGKQRTKGK